MSSLAQRVVVLATLALVAAPAGASAAVTTSQVTTPSDPTFLLNHVFGTWSGTTSDTLVVSGTSDGTSGDTVDLVCTYGNGDTNHRLGLLSSVAVQAGGSFSGTVSLADLELQTCVLRALPDGNQASLTGFTGPRVGVGEVDDQDDVSGTGAWLSHPTDFFAAASQLQGYMEWMSVSSCGLTYSYPYDATFGFAGNGTVASEPLFNCAGALYPVATSDNRSQIQIDGHSAVTAYGARAVTATGQILSGEYPTPARTQSLDPVSGDLTLTETEPLLFCLDGSHVIQDPPYANCRHLQPAGAHLIRTIRQTADGRQAWVTDSFADDTASSHDLVLSYDQHVGRDKTPEASMPQTRPSFSFGGAYAARATGAMVIPEPEAPGIIGVSGDPANASGVTNPQGAITYATTPDVARFFYENDPSPQRNDVSPTNPNPDLSGPNAADFELRYMRTIPAAGAVAITQVYSQALSRAEADDLANQAASSFVTPSVAIASPSAGATVTAPDVTVTGTASDRFTAVTLTVNGAAVAVGTGGAWSTALTLSPGANTVTAVATNGAGKTSQVQETLIYTPVPAPSCVVPAVTGLPGGAAAAAIVAAHCTRGQARTEYSATVRRDAVISQSPPPGTTKGNSFPVDLVVSLGPAPGKVGASNVETASTGGGELSMTLVVPGPGKLDVLATYDAPGRGARAAVLKPGRHRLMYARRISVLRRAQRLVIRLFPTRAAHAAVRRKRRHHQTLAVRVHVGFAPVDGHPGRRLVKTLHVRPHSHQP
jgi:Glucodextranase, domain B